MTQPRVRRAFALAALAALTMLSACAPPGQAGDPGVAAVYDGREITNEQVNAIYELWVHEAKDAFASRQEALTLELLRPYVLDAVAELGYGMSDAEAEMAATEFLRFQTLGTDPTPEFIDAVEVVYAIAVLSVLEPTQETLIAIAQDIEANAVFSPRSGEFSTGAIVATINQSISSSQSQELGPFFYTSFVRVNGMVEPPTPWIDRGTGS